MSYQPNAPVVIVAGMEKNSRAIGKENGLLWHVPEDMKRFKRLTLGHPVILGRKTFESILEILGKPLPGRTNIVVTRNLDYLRSEENVRVARSLEDAFRIAEQESPSEIHIGGGEELYKQALPYVSRLHLTFFDDQDVVGDTFFPPFSDDFKVTEVHPPAVHNNLTYQWIDYERAN
jgi:dihydrofolate reductase